MKQDGGGMRINKKERNFVVRISMQHDELSQELGTCSQMSRLHWRMYSLWFPVVQGILFHNKQCTQQKIKETKRVKSKTENCNRFEL